MQSFQSRSAPLWKKLLSRSVRYVSRRCAFAPPPVYASYTSSKLCLCSKTLRDELNVDHMQTAALSIQRAADCHLLAFELLCLFLVVKLIWLVLETFNTYTPSVFTIVPVNFCTVGCGC